MYLQHIPSSFYGKSFSVGFLLQLGLYRRNSADFSINFSSIMSFKSSPGALREALRLLPAVSVGIINSGNTVAEYFN